MENRCQPAKDASERPGGPGHPATGLMFHSGGDEAMDFDKLAQRIVRLAVEAIRLEWYGWRGFRRGIASNLYELCANEKVVQRILRHAKPHVTKGRYIKAFDPARDDITLSSLQRAAAVVGRRVTIELV